MRDPKAAGWPNAGERTESEEVARKWLPSYHELVMHAAEERQLGRPRRQRLGAALDAWLEHRRTRVARATLVSNETAADRLREAFGQDRAVSSIRPDELQRIFDGLLEAGYQRTTVKTERNIWSAFFRWAGHPDTVRLTDVPSPIERDIFTWSDDQLEVIRTAADKVDAQLAAKNARLAVEAALATGARQQELFALDWPAFSPTDRSVRISRQLSRYGAARYTVLKGKLSRTALVLPSFWEHYRPGTGLVLAHADGSPLRYRTATQLVQRILDTAGLNGVGLGWHTFRKTYGRLFLEAGGWMDELQRSLGHKSITTTERVYGEFGTDRALEFARSRIYGEGRSTKAAR